MRKKGEKEPKEMAGRSKRQKDPVVNYVSMQDLEAMEQRFQKEREKDRENEKKEREEQMKSLLDAISTLKKPSILGGRTSSPITTPSAGFCIA